MKEISLQRLLFEEPEQGPDALFGKYMFDDQRKDISKGKKEQPTPEEEEALSALARYVAFNDKTDLNKVAPVLLDLKQKGLYSPMLDPLKGGRTSVYRILFLTAEVAAAVFGIDINKQGGFVSSGMVNPVGDSPIQGWTTDPSMFKTILKTEGDDRKPVFLILKASLQNNNNFFGNPKRLAGTADEDFKHERETFAVGPVKYEKGFYFIAHPNKDTHATIVDKLNLALSAIKR